jgi:hypothetical protein
MRRLSCLGMWADDWSRRIGFIDVNPILTLIILFSLSNLKNHFLGLKEAMV